MAQFKLLIIMMCFSVYSASAEASNVHGIFKVVKGKVLVISKSGSQKMARIGLRVFPQDKIKTAANSRAKIVMTDSNIINVSPDTEVALSKYEFDKKTDKKNVLINVIYGKIRSKVSQKYEGENKFQVKTPSAVAGVRGTDFLTSYDSSSRRSEVITFEGRVEFGLPNGVDGIKDAVMVGIGKSSSLVAGRVPSNPIDLPVADLSKMNFDSDADAPEAPDLRQPADEGPAINEPEMNNEPSRDPNSANVQEPVLLPPPPPNELPPPPPDLQPMPTNDPILCGETCRGPVEAATRRLIINVDHQ